MRADLIEPYPYQQEGARFLAATPQAFLFDEPGLGKSCQTILAADMLGLSSILIFCPAAVRVNWEREFARFSPMDHKVTVLTKGSDKVPETGVVVSSYDLGINEKIRQQLKARRWDALVLDESHALKERTARRTRVIYGHGKRSPGIAANSDRVWRLTGTPVPNNVSELWTHLNSAGAIEMPYYDFVARYCTGFDSEFGFRITGHKNTDELKRLLAPLMKRRKKEEVLMDLPPIHFQEVTVERSAVDVDLLFFEQLRGKTHAEFNAKLKDQDTALRNALAAIQPSGVQGHRPGEDKLKLIESMAGNLVTLRMYIGIAKAPAIGDILAEELDNNPELKIVVFAVHRIVIEALRVRLAKYGAVTLYGGTPAEKRQSHIDRFQNDKKCRVFIGNVQAAGTGITLTSSSEVVFAECDWVPANNAQAAMRCHRIGQTRPVRVRFFSCAGSVDEQVQHALLRKTREISKLF